MPNAFFRPAPPQRLAAIRKAEPQDVAVIRGLLELLAIDEQRPGSVTAAPADLARDGFGDHPAFETLLAEIDGKAVGLAIVTNSYSTTQGKPVLFLIDLFVIEALRGMGIGKQLMAQVAAWALDRGCARVDLHVRELNAQAKRFYHRLGMRTPVGYATYVLVSDNLARLAKLAGPIAG